MTRTTLILVVVFAIVLAGAGTWWWFNREAVSDALDGDTNTTTNTEVNTNTASNVNVGGSLPTEVKGTTEMDATRSVGEISLHFSSVSKTDSSDGVPAGQGRAWVTVYFDAIPGEQILPLKRLLDATPPQLLTNRGNETVQGVKIANDAVTNDRGYLKFLVDAAATRYELTVDGSNPITLPL